VEKNPDGVVTMIHHILNLKFYPATSRKWRFLWRFAQRGGDFQICSRGIRGGRDGGGN